MKPTYLLLENGQVFTGVSPPSQNPITYGEAVFTTGMTGYPESLTDPSYTGQILTFTYPLIGNFGVPDSRLWESKKIHAAGVVIGELCENYSHYEAKWSFLEWLKQQNIPLICDVDTRALTKTLRTRGTMSAILSTKKLKDPEFVDPNQENLVQKASPTKRTLYENGKKKVVIVDCGMKENILRSLQKYPISILRVPFDDDFSNEEFDGVLISNGPGNPAECKETIAILRKVFAKKKPVFGICLGTQLMALAAGGSTYKLMYGHRGHNQPCIELETRKCFITSQNHGYAVLEESLPADWKVSFRNLNDQSVEGIMHKTLPFFSVQFHPEASPGPTDTLSLFDKFVKLL